MLAENRPYRKKLIAYGLIYLGGNEWTISVKNLSVTGLMAILDANDAIKNIKEVFESIQTSPLIDFYLPDIGMAGEAEVVRAEMIEKQINLALEFKSMSYNIDHNLYLRKAYRKNMTAPGQIFFNGKKYKFETQNVSVEGLMIRIDEKIEIEKETITVFDFKHLQLKGKIKVMWVEPVQDDEATLMGLQYIHMEKENIKGIPRFSPDNV